jgi:hypothetical protein
MLTRASKMDANVNVQMLIENAYVELEADLISLFAYNDITKRLECTVSRYIHVYMYHVYIYVYT